MLNSFKKKINQFKETERSNSVFWFCAVFPFFLTDFILRFFLNFIVVTDFKYYLVPILFNCFWIFGITYFCCGVLPKIIGKILYTVIYLFFGVLFFINYIYYCFFDQYMWIRNLVLAGEGLNYTKEALAYINLPVIILIILYILFLVVTLTLWKRPTYEKKYKKLVIAVAPFVLLLILQSGILLDTKFQIKNGAWEIWDRPVLVYKSFTDANKSLNVSGFYQFTIKSIYKEIVKTEPYTEEDKKEADSFFAEKQKLPDNSMTGILKDKYVVFVLMESIDDWIISEKYTPTIKYMMDNGINFTNHYMPHVGSGYTFNSEFAMNTGFYCPSVASSASIYTSNDYPYAMANLFAEQGYNVNSFHFNSKSFYNRNVMHGRFGYSNYYCLMNYMPTEKCVQDSEVAKNDDVYKLMTQDKFFDFFISYSCHLPYDTIDNKLKGALENYPELIDESLDEETKNIYLLAHDTDEFFRVLIERLKADGLYEDTVIIGVTDHCSYGLKDKEKFKEYTLAAGSSMTEKVPFFIYSPTLEPQAVEKVTSAIDIVPTITNMFGIDTGYYLGCDAFDESYTGYVYFPNGSWYDGKILYKPNSDMSQYTPEQIEYIEQMNKKIIKLNKITDYVTVSNYFKQ